MKRTISSLLIKVCILLGAFFLGLAARTHAQSPSQNQTGNQSDTTHHHYGMHRGWGHRPVTDAADKTGVAAKTDAAGATARTAGHPAAVITTAASDNAASDAKGSATLQNNASS